MHIVRTTRSRAARVSRLAVVVAAALVGLAGCGVGGASGLAPAGTAAAGTPAVTPGPQARYLHDVVTARGVTQNGTPIDPTSTFPAGTPIYVVCVVQGVAPGQSHRLTIRWYLHGQLARVDNAFRYATVTQDGPVSFRVTYPTAGAGLAKLYWDEPVADNSTQTNESFLAQAIAFTVQ